MYLLFMWIVAYTDCIVGMAWLICIQSMLVDLYGECGEAHEEWIIFKGLCAQDMCYENIRMVRMH